MIIKFALAALMVGSVAQAASAGALFPDVAARDMNGRNVVTREHRGQAVVYLVGFTHESRDEAKLWADALPRLTKQAAAGRALRVIRMPVLSGAGVFARPFIESGVARRTPEAERPDVMMTTDRDKLVKGLKVDEPDREGLVALVDEGGMVRLVLRGGPTEAKEQEFAAALEALGKSGS